MSKPSMRHLLAIVLAVLAPAMLLGAQKKTVTFDSDKLYKIVMQKNQQCCLEQVGNTVKLVTDPQVKPSQLWSITQLSGSWRFINAESGLAIRTDGNLVTLGANNGSDEAQLWKVLSMPPLILATNTHGMAIAVEQDGTLVLIPKKDAAIDPAAKYVFIAMAGSKIGRASCRERV